MERFYPLTQNPFISGVLYPSNYTVEQINIVVSAYLTETPEEYLETGISFPVIVGSLQNPALQKDITNFAYAVNKIPWSMFTEYLEYGIPFPSQHFEILVEGGKLNLTGALTNVRRRRMMSLPESKRDELAIANHPSVTVNLAASIIANGDPTAIEALKNNQNLTSEQLVMAHLIAANTKPINELG